MLLARPPHWAVMLAVSKREGRGCVCVVRCEMHRCGQLQLLHRFSACVHGRHSAGLHAFSLAEPVDGAWADLNEKRDVF